MKFSFSCQQNIKSIFYQKVFFSNPKFITDLQLQKILRSISIEFIKKIITEKYQHISKKDCKNLRLL